MYICDPFFYINSVICIYIYIYAFYVICYICTYIHIHIHISGCLAEPENTELSLVKLTFP